MNPRRASRVASEGLTCQMGQIVDLSETGLRLRSSSRIKLEVGSQLKLTIASSMQRVSVTGQVVWVRNSLLKGSAGIRFVDTPPAVARALVELARHGFIDPDCKASHEEQCADEVATVGGSASPTSTSNPSAASGSQDRDDRSKGGQGNDGQGKRGQGRGARSASAEGAASGKPVRADVHVEDYYGALGVMPNATTVEIHAAYRSMARKLHPDLNDSPDAATRFAYLARAYGVLKDPAQRMRHDDLRRAVDEAA